MNDSRPAEGPPIVRSDGALTWKNVAVMLSGVAAIAAVHAYFVVPGILREAASESRSITREMLSVKDKEVDLTIKAALAPVLAELRALREDVQRLERQVGEGR